MATLKRSFGLQWHLTDRCDQHCVHCYIWRNQKTIDDNQCDKELGLADCIIILEKFLQFCEIFNVNPLFIISGGDPLLFPWIWQLLEYLLQKKISFTILGNPFHLNQTICQRLEYLGCNAYQLSLDGLENTHDALRRKGSYRATIQGIEMLQRTKIKTVVMSTISRLNHHEITELIKVVTQIGVNVYDFGRYCPAPDNREDINTTLTPQEYREFLSKVWNSYMSLADCGTKFGLKDHLWKLFLYEKGLFKTRHKDRDIVLQGCGCGIKHLTLLPDGTVYACRRFESPVGNVLSQSFKDIFLSKELGQYREIDRIEGCRDCELLNYCRGCHATSYGVFGSFFAKDPQCWR